MHNETIVLLTYYYHQEDADHPIIKHLVKSGYCSSYLPWKMYLHEPLQKIFSRVIVYDYLKRRAEVGLEAMNEEIIELVRKEGAKFVIWTSFYYDVRESTLQTLRQNGAVVLGWFFDDEWRFDSYSRYWIPYLDYCVTNAIEAIPKYEALGAKVVYTIPNTGVAFDYSKVNAEYEVSFVGSIDFADRKQFLSKLKRENIPVQYFGGKGGRYLSFDQMIDVFKTTRINLNFSKAGAYYWVRQIKGRIFQVCLAGGFMLTEYSPGIETFFEIGKEIACFDNEREMVEKIKYYLHHDEERRTIARAGWERSRNSYTASHMVANVFNEIEQERKTETERHVVHSRGPELKMSLITRTTLPAQYHYEWSKALLQENYKRAFSKDAIKLAHTYSPINVSVWYCQFVEFSPPFMRPSLFGFYDVSVRLAGKLLSGLRSTPVLGNMLQRLVGRLF